MNINKVHRAEACIGRKQYTFVHTSHVINNLAGTWLVSLAVSPVTRSWWIQYNQEEYGEAGKAQGSDGREGEHKGSVSQAW